jgi:hypothetical protein
MQEAGLHYIRFSKNAIWNHSTFRKYPAKFPHYSTPSCGRWVNAPREHYLAYLIIHPSPSFSVESLYNLQDVFLPAGGKGCLFQKPG